MEQIMYCGVLVFLAILSADDIKEKKVSVRKVGAGAVAAILGRIFAGQFLIMEMVWGCVPGLILFALSVITRESIGKGDGIVVMVLGLWTDVQWVILTGCLAIWAAGIFALICLLRKRKEPIAFVPFLLLGMEVLLLYA